MSESLQSILGAETLAAFEAGGPVASGLPGAAYTSEAFLALENERIFADSWVFAGFAHELSRPGDITPVTVAGPAPPPPRGPARPGGGLHHDGGPPSWLGIRSSGSGPSTTCAATGTSSSSTRPETSAGQSGAPTTPGPTDSTACFTSPPTSAGASPARCRPASTAGGTDSSRCGRRRGTTGSSST